MNPLGHLRQSPVYGVPLHRLKQVDALLHLSHHEHPDPDIDRVMAVGKTLYFRIEDLPPVSSGFQLSDWTADTKF